MIFHSEKPFSSEERIINGVQQLFRRLCLNHTDKLWFIEYIIYHMGSVSSVLTGDQI